MKLSEYLKQNGMTSKEYFDMQKRKASGKTTLTDYRRTQASSLKSKIGFDTFKTDLETIGSTVDNIYNGWQPQETMANTRSTVESMKERIGAFQEYQKLFGGDDSIDISDLANSYDTVLNDWDSLTEVYGQYKNADAFNAVRKKAELEKKFSHKDGRGYTFEEVQKELKKYAPDSDEYKYLSTYTNYSDLNDFNKALNHYETAGVQEQSDAMGKKDGLGLAHELNGVVKWNGGIGVEIPTPDLSDAKNSPNVAGDDFYAELQRKKNKWELDNKFDLYKGYTEAEDFEEKSQYWDGHVWATDNFKSAQSAAPKDAVIAYDKESKTYYVYSDPLYEYVNNKNNARSNLTKGVVKGDYKKLGLEYSNKGYDELTEEEIGVFNLIDATEGHDKALEYLEEMSPTLTKRKYEKQTGEWEEAVDSGILAEIGLSAATVPAKSVGAMGNLFASIDEFIKGEEYNPYHRYRAVGNFASDTRGYTSENIAERTEGMELFGQNIPSFLYNTGMSVLDSAYGVATTGRFHTALMGSSAFQDKAKEMVEAGENQDVVWRSAITSGVAEMLFEHIGIDNLFKIKSVDSLSSAVKSALKQAGAEGFEEIGTEITNIIADDVIRGKNSELYKTYSDLIARGYSEKEALAKTALQAGGQVAWAGIGGALSGTAMGSVASAKNYSDNKTQGKTIRGNERVDDMLNIASMTPQESDTYNAYTEYANRGINADNITDAQLGNLYGMAKTDAVETLTSKDGLFKKGATEGQKVSAIKTLNELDKVNTDNVAAKKAKELTKDLKTSENTEIVETGKTVAIKGIKIDTNEVITSEGETLSENDVTFSERDIELLGYAKQMDETTANLFLEIDDGKADVEYYAESFNLAMKYTENNFTQETILENKGALSDSQVGAIYEATVINTYKAKQSAVAKLNAKHGNVFTVQGKVDESVIDYDNTGAEGKVAWNSLNSSQRKAITFMKGLARATGMNLRLISDGLEQGINGAYKISENTIILDIYAGMDKVEGTDFSDSIIPTASHEMTHWMKEKAPALYRAVDELVFNTLKKSGLTEREILDQRKIKMMENHPGQEFSDEEVRDEVIARACEDVLAMSEEGKRLFNSLSETEQKTFVEKIQEIIQNLKDWVSDLLSKYKSNSPEAREMRKYQDSLEELSKLWDEMLKQAIQTNQSLAKEGITGEELAAKVTNKQGKSADEQFAGREKYWRTGFSYAEYKELLGIAKFELGKSTGYIDNDTKWLYNNQKGKSYFAIYSTIDVDDPTILYASKGKTAQNESQWFEIFIAEKELLENGSNDLQRTTINEVLVSLGYALDQSGVHNGINVSQRGGNNGNVKVYSGTSGVGPSRALRNCLEKLAEVQERNERNGITQYSDRDTLGNSLTKDQQSYFAESKVRDENGNLKVMYHGTPNATFTKFRSGTYFTEHKWYADNYQNQGASSLSYKNTADNPDTYAVYLNIKKPFDTRNKKERDIFKNEYYRQWGTGTDLMESGLPDWLDGQDLQEFLEEQGYDYDGLILDEGGIGGYGDEVIYRGLSYVVFSPEQVKSVENKTPTNDSDYRFSMRDRVEETKDLVAVHNMQVSELEKSLQLGGLPMPSIAIIKAQSGHSEYGDVSLVFNKNTIDPKLSKDNKVYGGDAWTPTYPTIEYKANEKVANRITKLYYELSKKYGYDESKALYNVAQDLEDELNRFKGEEGLIANLKDDTRLMQLYLLQSGKGKIDTVIKETKTELTEAEIERYDYLINALGEDIINNIKANSGENTMSHRRAYFEENGSKIETAYKQLLSELYGFSEEQVQNVMDNMKRLDYVTLIRGAYNYLHNGTTTVKTEEDYQATNEAIRETVKDTDYNQWIDDLFKGAAEKSGIRNNVDYFTPSGNRRSFEALHWENNLENVIRVMKSQDETGGGALISGFGIFGVSAKNYKSVAEIKADSDRLTHISEEEYKEIRKGFSERLNEICESIMDKSMSNQFIALDNACECVVEAIRTSKTKSGILNNLKQYRHLSVTETTVDDIVALVTDISNMPTEYFEAKPRRVVGFDEVATAIIPDSTSDELKTMLTDNGVKFVEYEKGNDEARLEALNSLEDVKFSDRDTENQSVFTDIEGKERKLFKHDVFGYRVMGTRKNNSYFASVQEAIEAENENIKSFYAKKLGVRKSYIDRMVKDDDQFLVRLNSNDIRYSDRDNVSAYETAGELARLRKENDKFKAEVERLKERLALERKATGGTTFNRNQLDAVAAHIRNLSNSDYSKKELVKQLDDVYTYIITAKELTWDDLYSKLYDISKTVLEESRLKKVDENYYYKTVLKDIRSKKFSLSDVQKQELESAYGTSWNKVVFGKLNISNDATMDLDSQWSEWANVYPGLFDVETTEGDQIIKLLELYDDLKDGSEIYEDLNNEDMTRWLANEIYNQYWNVSTVKTTADKYEKQIKMLNWEHRKMMKDLRDNYQDRLAKQKQADKSKYNEIIKKIRERKKEEIREVRKLGKERMDRYKEAAARKTRIQSITSQALTLNEWLIKNSKDKHIHESLKGPVAYLIQAIDFSSKQLLGNGNPTRRDISLAAALSKVQKMMADATVGKDELVELYGHGLDDDIKAMMDSVDAIMHTVGDNEFVLNKMTLNDLITLDNMVKTIKHAVTKMNKFHAVHHARGISNLAQETIADVDELGKAKIYNPEKMKGKIQKLLNWRNTVPYYAFKRFGNSGKKIFEAFQDGWDKLAFNVKEIIDFTNNTYKAKEVQEWEKELHTFSLRMPATEEEMSIQGFEPQYQEVQMTTAQIMHLYLLNKRSAAKSHLLGGGIRVADIETKKGEVISQSDGVIFEQSEIDSIIKTLTPDQIKVADALSKFMNTTSSDWGNEVSMARFGYKAFGEENYVPIQADKNNLAGDDETEKGNSLFKLLNMSFTHSLIDDANNRIVISSLFDVFAQHTSDMAKYNALALPVLDAFRWFNYKEKGLKGDQAFITKSVKTSIEKAFGKDGQSYIRTFLKDINGQENVTRDTIGRGFFKNAKIASVAANIRVALLQPTAYLKASANIDNKYLMKALFHTPKIAKAEKYCGMALWKSMGYFDTNIQRGVAEQIKHAETKTDKLIEWSMKGAEWGDKLTFGYLWNASELEVREKRKDLKVGSEEFFNEVGKRLRDVIYSTQVVDSTLTRSEMMRSNDGWDKVLTVFASEPTIAYNMLQDAYMEMSLEARRLKQAGEKHSGRKAFAKHGKRMARVLVAYTATNIVAAIIESGFDVLRDDDEEEMNLAEFMKLYIQNFADNQMILTKIPYAKELVSIMQGFTSTRTDTQWMTSFSNALRQVYKLVEGDGNPVKLIKNVLQTFSYFTGLPFYNVYRDFMATLDKFEILTTEDLEDLLSEFVD